MARSYLQVRQLIFSMLLSLVTDYNNIYLIINTPHLLKVVYNVNIDYVILSCLDKLN